jgi:riboflavin transporter FmnP
MNDREQRSIIPGLAIVIVLALVVTLLGYFATRMMDADVSGSGNTRVGLSAALVAGIACLSALGGAVILWSGRTRARSNTSVAVLGTLVIGVFLLLLAFAAGTSSTEPASTTVEQG